MGEAEEVDDDVRFVDLSISTRTSHRLDDVAFLHLGLSQSCHVRFDTAAAAVVVVVVYTKAGLEDACEVTRAYV